MLLLLLPPLLVLLLLLLLLLPLRLLLLRCSLRVQALGLCGRRHTLRSAPPAAAHLCLQRAAPPRVSISQMEEAPPTPDPSPAGELGDFFAALLDAKRGDALPPGEPLQHLFASGAVRVLELKAAHRRLCESAEALREATSEAKSQLDAGALQLQNLLYEQQHYEKEIKGCRAFRSAYTDAQVGWRVCGRGGEAGRRAPSDHPSLSHSRLFLRCTALHRSSWCPRRSSSPPPSSSSSRRQHQQGATTHPQRQQQRRPRRRRPRQQAQQVQQQQRAQRQQQTQQQRRRRCRPAAQRTRRTRRCWHGWRTSLRLGRGR